MKRKALFAAIGISLLTLMCHGQASAQPPRIIKQSKPVPTLAMQPEWIADAVIYEANLRQGTADRNLKGLQRELPRLKDLGVDIVWLMPIHPISEKNRKGDLGSYYSVKDYKAVNPEFGTMEDMQEFVRTAHSLGMKVIIDEVCNHTGCDNAWVTEHPDYYAKNEKGEMFGPYDWTDTYQLDYSNPALRRAMIDNLRYWIEEADIDGYRMDVAMEVPTDFWEDAAVELNGIKPVFMLAEASKPELTVQAFAADYNWPMKDVFNAIAANHGVNKFAKEKGQNLPAYDANQILVLLDEQKASYPRGAINMNMVTNHDLNSWEGTEFERYGEGTGAFAVLSYTLPGIPMMYTGQEVGNNKAFEFFELDTVPDYSANEVTAFYEMLNALKHKNHALDAGLEGGMFIPYATSNDNVIAFERRKGDDQVVVVLANLSENEVPVEFTDGTPDLTGMTEYFTSSAAEMPTVLAPWQYYVFTRSAQSAQSASEK